MRFLQILSWRRGGTGNLYAAPPVSHQVRHDLSDRHEIAVFTVRRPNVHVSYLLESKPHGVVELRTKTDSRCSSGTLLEYTRYAAEELVEFERSTGLSTMDAYERVGSDIGRSASWVRRFINGYGDARPDLVVSVMIFRFYESLCERVERDNARRQARLAELQGKIDAAIPRSLGAVAGLAPGAPIPAENLEDDPDS